ncbi:MAG: amidohydrolase family protein, partial [Bifidobacteriaceae bacterium]|nr:amidohydrolase family protein [Bifidobacteriaceae bacterium]
MSAGAGRADKNQVTVLRGIGELVTNAASSAPDDLGLVSDAVLVLRGGRVEWAGPAGAAAAPTPRAGDLDLRGAAVIPGLVDSHTHLVFAGDRAAEFEARQAGRPYSAGGIATTVQATRAASDGALRAALARQVAQARAHGTTTLEIKSGYGLTVADEARSCRLAHEFTDEVTFLGAHVVPSEYQANPAGYVDLVTGPMLEACRPYARWIDVFCDQGAFSEVQAERILRAGAAAELGLRLHAAQLAPSGAVRLGVRLGAAAIDHCTFLEDADVAALAGSQTVATLLPGAEFSTRQPYPSGRRLIDAGVTVALASDCNPGS